MGKGVAKRVRQILWNYSLGNQISGPRKTEA